jgi:hypothetical protein
MSRTRLTPILLLGSLLAATPALAQVRLVDEGTFSLFVEGERVGREDFSIRAAPGAGGSTFVAQGNVLRGEQRLSVALNADSAGFPLRFQLTVRVDGRETETILGEARRGIWMGRAVRSGGESAREFRLPPGAIAAEEDVVHQVWFVVRAAGGRTLALLSPRTLALRQVAVEDGGADVVRLGTLELDARRWVLRPVDGGEPVREVWTDAEGRVLRVRVAARGLDALRDDAPSGAPGGAPGGASSETLTR